MSCDAINDIFSRESGRFYGEIYNRLYPTSPWVGLVKRGEYPQGMGIVLSNLTYERSAPTDAVPEWAALTVTDGAEGGSCLPSSTKIPISSTVRTWRPYRRVLEGPDICLTDIYYDFQLRDQLGNVQKIITEYTKIEWEIRYRHDFLGITTNKTVANQGADYSTGTGWPGTNASSTLTQGFLNRAKQQLLRDGAIFSALGKENGSAILTLVTSAETSDDLIFQNEDIRQDLRWGKPNELLAPYGVERSYRGFYHLIDNFPIKYSDAAGATEVSAFTTSATTKGNRSVVNPAWTNAGYMASFIFDPMVFESQIPKPTSTPHEGFVFDPITYLGDWRWKNIPDRVCNPDGTIGFHRGHLGEAAKPIHPERGWAFLHKVCAPSLNVISQCS